MIIACSYILKSYFLISDGPNLFGLFLFKWVFINNINFFKFLNCRLCFYRFAFSFPLYG